MLTTTYKVEKKAVKVVSDYIDKCSFLDSVINYNDKTQIWDGDIFVYDCYENKKSDFIGRIPVQVKGRSSESLELKDASFSIERATIEAFRKDGDCFFFFVKINEDEAKIYYRYFSVSDSDSLLESQRNKKNISIKFQSIPENEYDFQNLIFKCIEKHYSTISKHDIDQLKDIEARVKILRNIFKYLQQAQHSDSIDLIKQFDAEYNILYKEYSRLIDLFEKSKSVYSTIESISNKYNNNIISFLFNRNLEWHDIFIVKLKTTLDSIKSRKIFIWDVLLFDLLLDFCSYLLYHNYYFNLLSDYYDWALCIALKFDKKEPANCVKIANVLNKYAIYCCMICEYEKAEEIFNQYSQIEKEIDEMDPSGGMIDKSKIRNTMGLMYFEKENYPKAEELLKSSLAIRKEYFASNPDYKYDIANSLNNLALVYINLVGKEDLALADLLESLKLYKEIQDTNNVDLRSNIAGCYRNIGRTYYKIKNYQEAVAHYSKSLKIHKKLSLLNPNSYNEEYSNVCYDLGLAYIQIDKKLALKYFNQALFLAQNCLANNPNKLNKYIKKLSAHINDLKKKKK